MYTPNLGSVRLRVDFDINEAAGWYPELVRVRELLVEQYGRTAAEAETLTNALLSAALDDFGAQYIAEFSTHIEWIVTLRGQLAEILRSVVDVDQNTTILPEALTSRRVGDLFDALNYHLESLERAQLDAYLLSGDPLIDPPPSLAVRRAADALRAEAAIEPTPETDPSDVYSDIDVDIDVDPLAPIDLEPQDVPPVLPPLEPGRSGDLEPLGARFLRSQTAAPLLGDQIAALSVGQSPEVVSSILRGLGRLVDIDAAPATRLAREASDAERTAQWLETRAVQARVRADTTRQDNAAATARLRARVRGWNRRLTAFEQELIDNRKKETARVERYARGLDRSGTTARTAANQARAAATAAEQAWTSGAQLRGALQGMSRFLAQGGHPYILARIVDTTNTRYDYLAATAVLERLNRLGPADYASLQVVVRNRRGDARTSETLIGMLFYIQNDADLRDVLQVLQQIEPRATGLSDLLGYLGSSSSNLRIAATGEMYHVLRELQNYAGATVVFEEPRAGATTLRIPDFRLEFGPYSALGRISYEVKEISATRLLRGHATEQLARDILDELENPPPAPYHALARLRWLIRDPDRGDAASTMTQAERDAFEAGVREALLLAFYHPPLFLHPRRAELRALFQTRYDEIVILQ